MVSILAISMAFAAAFPGDTHDNPLETGNTILFGDDKSQPVEVTGESRVTCSFDKAQIAYTIRSSGDRITGASINTRSIGQPDLDAVNLQIGHSSIERIEWKRCPTKSSGGGGVAFYIMLSTSAAKKFLIIDVTRNGSLRRVESIER